MGIKLVAICFFVAASWLAAGAFARSNDEGVGSGPYGRIDKFCDATVTRISRPFVRVYFYASESCPPCKAAAKAVEKIKKRRSEIIAVDASTKFGERFRERYRTTATPSFVCVVVDPASGKETVFDRWTGSDDAEKRIAFAFERGLKIAIMSEEGETK